MSPHLNRVIVFVDIDGDSTFSAVPDSIYGLPSGADVDSTRWVLEPWGLVEGIVLEPGMEAEFSVPTLGDSLVAWFPPAPAPSDSLEAAVTDSTSLVPEIEELELEQGREGE